MSGYAINMNLDFNTEQFMVGIWEIRRTERLKHALFVDRNSMFLNGGKKRAAVGFVLGNARRSISVEELDIGQARSGHSRIGKWLPVFFQLRHLRKATYHGIKVNLVRKSEMMETRTGLGILLVTMEYMIGFVFDWVLRLSVTIVGLLLTGRIIGQIEAVDTGEICQIGYGCVFHATRNMMVQLKKLG